VILGWARSPGSSGGETVSFVVAIALLVGV